MPLPGKTVLSGLLSLTLFCLPGCATNPVTGKQDFVLMSEQEEISLGNRYHQQVLQDMPAYDDPGLAAYVDQVGQRVAAASHRPGLTYTFTVVDSPTVNAFALPGGYIYITRGILAYLNSEAELAAVLGHEVGHVTARHSVRQHSAATATSIATAVLGAATGIQGTQDLFDIFGKAMLSGYGREHELESDRLGAQYLARTGYDPQAMLDVIGVLKNQELFEQQRAREEGRQPRAYHGVFATHPDNDRRLQEVVNEAQALRTAGQTRVGRDAFLKHMNGVAFGPGEQDGIIVGRQFLHKPLDFNLTFPESWEISNHPERLVAVAPGKAALMEVTVSPRPANTTPRQFLQQQGVKRPTGGESLQLKNFDSFTARGPVATGFGKRMGRFSVVFDGDHAYLFRAVSRNKDNQAAFDRQFKQIAASFRRLTTAEKKRAAGLRLKLITAKAGMRIASLARQSPIPKYAESELRLLNSLYPEGEPKAGQTLKVVR